MAKNVDQLSAEELLRENQEEEEKEPNFAVKAALRGLDVLFLVVEKGVSVAPDAASVVQRAVTRVTETKLKDSAGASVGWELHNGIIRGENRY